MKHRVPILKFINKDESDEHSFGQEEAFALIGGRWYYAGYVANNFDLGPNEFGYYLLKQHKSMGRYITAVSSFRDKLFLVGLVFQSTSYVPKLSSMFGKRP